MHFLAGLLRRAAATRHACAAWPARLAAAFTAPAGTATFMGPANLPAAIAGSSPCGCKQCDTAAVAAGHSAPACAYATAARPVAALAIAAAAGPSILRRKSRPHAATNGFSAAVGCTCAATTRRRRRRRGTLQPQQRWMAACSCQRQTHSRQQYVHLAQCSRRPPPSAATAWPAAAAQKEALPEQTTPATASYGTGAPEGSALRCQPYPAQPSGAAAAVPGASQQVRLRACGHSRHAG